MGKICLATPPPLPLPLPHSHTSPSHFNVFLLSLSDPLSLIRVTYLSMNEVLFNEEVSLWAVTPLKKITPLLQGLIIALVPLGRVEPLDLPYLGWTRCVFIFTNRIDFINHDISEHQFNILWDENCYYYFVIFELNILNSYGRTLPLTASKLTAC